MKVEKGRDFIRAAHIGKIMYNQTFPSKMFHSVNPYFVLVPCPVLVVVSIEEHWRSRGFGGGKKSFIYH